MEGPLTQGGGACRIPQRVLHGGLAAWGEELVNTPRTRGGFSGRFTAPGASLRHWSCAWAKWGSHILKGALIVPPSVSLKALGGVTASSLGGVTASIGICRLCGGLTALGLEASLPRFLGVCWLGGASHRPRLVVGRASLPASLGDTFWGYLRMERGNG